MLCRTPVNHVRELVRSEDLSSEGRSCVVDDTENAGGVEGDEQVVDAKANGSGDHRDGDGQAAAVCEFMEGAFAEFVGPHLEVVDGKEFGVDAVFVHAVAIIDGDDEELLVALGAGRGEGVLMTHGVSLHSCLIVELFNSITLLNGEPAG